MVLRAREGRPALPQGGVERVGVRWGLARMAVGSGRGALGERGECCWFVLGPFVGGCCGVWGGLASVFGAVSWC